jgi:hypothetical protein
MRSSTGFRLGQIRCEPEIVQRHDLGAGHLTEQEMHEVRADEAARASHKVGRHLPEASKLLCGGLPDISAVGRARSSYAPISWR